MIISKTVIFFILLLSIGFSYQIGIKKWLMCVITASFGYLFASLTFKKKFSLPSFYKIEKKNLAFNNLYDLSQFVNSINRNFKKPNTLSLKGSASSSSIQSLLLPSVAVNDSKKPRSPTSANNTKFNDSNFESYFKRSYPWQSVFIPDNIDRAIEEFMSSIIQHVILPWYSEISSDDGFIYELKTSFRHIIANFIHRLKRVDINHFITFKLNTILFNHLNDFIEFHNNSENSADLKNLKTFQERLEKQFEIFKLIVEKSKDSSTHVALYSRKNELAYLKQVCKQALPFLLPESILKCRVTLELVEEITVSNLLLQGLDIIAKPDSINKLIIKAIESHKKNSKIVIIDDNRNYVQLLKHWCQMNGRIYKTVLAPNFIEIIENNDLLHVFINYLNSCNSLSILQLYLMLKDMLKGFEETSNDSSNSFNISSQMEELKNWCHQNKQSLEAINFDSKYNYYTILNTIVSSDILLNDLSNTQKILKEIHSELYDLIRQIYYTSFIKSDFMYKNLIGLNKLNPKPNSKLTQKKKIEKSNESNETSESKSEKDNNSILLDDLNSNNDIEIDEFNEYLNENSYMNNHRDQLIEIEDNENEEEDDLDNFDFSNNDETQIRPGSEIRLDLINEINDEFSDGESFEINSSNDNNNKSFNNDPNLNEEEEEEDEDDEENENDVENINLNNLRISIDDIEEVSDKSNKTCYVFVIQVWRFQAKISTLDEGKNENFQEKAKLKKMESFEELPSWCVKRKYDEFYVLDSRLKEFHGGLFSNSEYNINKPNTITAQLPPKQRALFFINNAKNFEFLYSIRNDFAKYLQSLLTNPMLSMSQLIKSFLDPHSIEFSSSIFNDITNIGKMVKGVPYKLRVERGQSLDSFLMYLLKVVKPPKAKASSKNESFEDITEKKLNNKFYNNSDKNKKLAKIKQSKINSEIKLNTPVLITPFESFMCLINKIYIVPSYLSLILFSLRNFIHKTFDSIIYWVVSEKLKELTSPETIEELIILFKEIIFEDTETKETSEELYETAFESMNQYIYAEFLNFLIKTSLVSNAKLKPGVEQGTRLFLESFQYPIWNKNLSYHLLDALLQEIFPELEKLNKK